MNAIDKQKLINLLEENLPNKSEINKITTEATKVSIISGVLNVVNSGQLDVCEVAVKETDSILTQEQEKDTPATNN